MKSVIQKWQQTRVSANFQWGQKTGTGNRPGSALLSGVTFANKKTETPKETPNHDEQMTSCNVTKFFWLQEQTKFISLPKGCSVEMKTRALFELNELLHWPVLCCAEIMVYLLIKWRKWRDFRKFYVLIVWFMCKKHSFVLQHGSPS